MTTPTPPQAPVSVEDLRETAERIRDWIIDEPTSKPPFWEIRVLCEQFIGREPFEELGE